MAARKHTRAGDRDSKVRITVIVQNRYTFDTPIVTGRQVKERANIPAGFSLHRRASGGNEPIRDDQPVELHDGDHFFSRPPSTSHEERARTSGHISSQPSPAMPRGNLRA
jgi:hypothetical protein